MRALSIVLADAAVDRHALGGPIGGGGRGGDQSARAVCRAGDSAAARKIRRTANSRSGRAK